MGGIDNIIEKINADGEERANAVVAKAQESANAVKAARLAEAEAKTAEIAEQYEKEAAAAYRRIMSSATQKCRANELAARRSLVSQAFENAYRTLCEKPDDQLCEIMAKLAAPEIKTGREVLLLSPALERLCKPLSQAVNCPSETSARVTDVGVVIKCGDIEQNKTFGAIIREKREALEASVVDILF